MMAANSPLKLAKAAICAFSGVGALALAVAAEMMMALNGPNALAVMAALAVIVGAFNGVGAEAVNVAAAAIVALS